MRLIQVLENFIDQINKTKLTKKSVDVFFNKIIKIVKNLFKIKGYLMISIQNLKKMVIDIKIYHQLDVLTKLVLFQRNNKYIC